MPPISGPATTWNDLATGVIEGTGDPLATTPETFDIADMVDTANVATGVSFTLANETGFNAWDFTLGTGGDGGLINDPSVYSDGLLSNDRIGIGRDLTTFEHFFTLTFSGLDDSLSYDFVGGYARNDNLNFFGTFVADGALIDDGTGVLILDEFSGTCLLYTSPSPRDRG